MTGLLPEMVLTNRLSGLQGADWYEKLESQRSELTRQVAEFSTFFAGAPGDRRAAARMGAQPLAERLAPARNIPGV